MCKKGLMADDGDEPESFSEDRQDVSTFHDDNEEGKNDVTPLNSDEENQQNVSVMKNKKNKISKEEKCKLCGKVFMDPHEHTLHLKEHNKDSKNQYACKLCGKQLSSTSSLDRHLLIHSGERPYICPTCKESFTTNGNMNRHMRTHTKKKRPQSKNGNPSKRQKICSDIKTSKAEDEKNTFETPPSNLKEEKQEFEDHSCEACIHGFQELTQLPFSSEKFALYAKVNCEKNVRCSPSTRIGLNTIDKNTLQYMNLPKVCPVCNTSFSCSRSLTLHTETHFLNSVFDCKICKINFSTVLEFKNHQYNKHKFTNEIYNAEILQKYTMEKNYFMNQLGLVQNKNDTNKISHADRKSNENSEKNFSYEASRDEAILLVNSKQDCQTKTNQDIDKVSSVVSLTSSPSVHETITSPSPGSPAPSQYDQQIPSVCGSANSNVLLVTPTSSQNCVQIPENFTTSQNSVPIVPNASENIGQFPVSPDEGSANLPQISGSDTENTNISSLNVQPNKVEHEMREKKYIKKTVHKCPKCTYTSLDKSTLSRHMRTHNGERPFKCSLCDYAFTTKANTHRHIIKTHHILHKEASQYAVYNNSKGKTKLSEEGTNDSIHKVYCQFCKKSFENSRVLQHHLRSTSTSCPRKPYFCKKCHSGFTTKNNCTRHITNQHPGLGVNQLIQVNKLQRNGKGYISEEADEQILNLSDSENLNNNETKHLSNDFENSVKQEENSQNILNTNYTIRTDHNLPVCSDVFDAAHGLMSLSKTIPFPKIDDLKNSDPKNDISNVNDLRNDNTNEDISNNDDYIDNNPNNDSNDGIPNDNDSSDGIPNDNDSSDDIPNYDSSDDILNSSNTKDDNNSMDDISDQPLDLSVTPVDLSSRNIMHYDRANITQKLFISRPSLESVVPTEPQPAHVSSLMPKAANSNITTCYNRVTQRILTNANRLKSGMLSLQPAHTSTPMPKTANLSQAFSIEVNNFNKKFQSLSPITQTTKSSEGFNNETVDNSKKSQSSSLIHDNSNEANNLRKKSQAQPSFQLKNSILHQSTVNSASHASYKPETGFKKSSEKKDNKCQFCDRTFSNKSNKDRHIKKQHYQQNQRAKNNLVFMPAISDHQRGSLLQSTKNSLRSMITNKYQTPFDEDTTGSERQLYIVENMVVDSSNESSYNGDKLLNTASRTEYESNDLASVTSVINTVNSQLISRYLKDASVTDAHTSKSYSMEDHAIQFNMNRNVNTKNRYICEHCKQQFSSSSARERHMTRHTGEKNFVCSECKSRFTTKSNRDRHEKNKCCSRYKNQLNTEHGKFSDKTESSEFVNNVDNHKDGQDKHINQPVLNGIDTHPIMDNNQSLPSNDMNIVANVPTNVVMKDFECEICNNTYKNETDLNNHMRELHPIEYNSSMGELFYPEDTILSFKRNTVVKKRPS